MPNDPVLPPNDHGTRFLIIHADDLGLAHSVNQAAFDAFEADAISSASVMVPCPWFLEVADYAKIHQNLDIGVHLTVTSEWTHYKWRSISNCAQVRGLLDSLGYFWESTACFRANFSEVEHELRAQIKQAIAAGIKPTHIDTHMFALLSEEEYAQAYVQTSREFRLPLMAPLFAPEYVSLFPAAKHFPPHADYRVNIVTIGPETPSEQWLDRYLALLRKLRPGLNELIVHPGYDTPELQAITAGKDAWGAAWRQRDLDVLMNPSFRAACGEENIRVVNWRTFNPFHNPRP